MIPAALFAMSFKTLAIGAAFTSFRYGIMAAGRDGSLPQSRGEGAEDAEENRACPGPDRVRPMHFLRAPRVSSATLR